MKSLSITYPSTKTTRHYLFEIDPDKKVAYCSACGWTEIHVPKARKKANPKIFCIKRYRELCQSVKDRYRFPPHWKPRHSLSEIDSINLTAICAVCGPVEIRKQTSKKSDYYMCVISERVSKRKYQRRKYSSKVTNPLAHVLSQIDEENKLAVCSRCGPVEIYIWQGNRKIGRRCSNAPVGGMPGAEKVRREININIINKRKVEHGCNSCGYNANLLRLDLYSSTKKPLKMEKLLRLNSMDLMNRLENSEILCVNCR